tara:strand:- start:1890 stop:2789 length:900 start_codon:yes stop_codon:yes gene_type:complete
MDNIVPIKANKPHRSDYFEEESDLYFKVWERPAFFSGGGDKYYQDRQHKHMVRMTDNGPRSIGLVGRNYKQLPTQELCETIEDAFVESLTHEQLKSARRSDSMSYYGGTCIRQYVFPEINADINSDRSKIHFRVVVVNGYDGTSSFKIYAGAIDGFCANGMVTGIYDMTTRRHTAGLTIPNLLPKVERSIDIFYTQSERWKHWVGKTISDVDAKECFEALPNVSENLVKKLMRQFRIECQDHGRTVWALYSAATYYATHSEGEFKVRETGLDHKASTLINREKQVRSWVETDQFKLLAA